MSDLISKSALIEYLEKVTVTEEITFETGFKQILTDIKNQPTVESVRGEWIPVSERLPEENGEYLCQGSWVGGYYMEVYSFATNLEDVCSFDFEGKKYAGFYSDDAEYCLCETAHVIAWMPLSEPYRKDVE